MEGIQTGISAQASYKLYQVNAKFEIQATILSGSLQEDSSGSTDTVDTSLSALYQGLTGTAKSVVDKINELLKTKLPNGVQSLKPEEVTPEATAERIVNGVAGLFNAYQKSNPDLGSEELLQKFMDAVRSGVQTGYDDAFDTLQTLGAFEFDGVQDGVEQTKIQIESKLKDLEGKLKKQLGLDVDGAATDIAKTALLAQGGAAVTGSQLSVVA